MDKRSLILEAESLRSQIDELKSQDLAPDNCGLSCWKSQENVHILLVFRAEDGTQSTQYLGKADCRAHFEWETKIARRDASIALQQQLASLEMLLRHLTTWEKQQALLRKRFRQTTVQSHGDSLVDPFDLSALYSAGDQFTWAGESYSVVSAGQQVLLLTDGSGKPCYFKHGQIVVPQHAVSPKKKSARNVLTEPIHFSWGFGSGKRSRSVEVA